MFWGFWYHSSVTDQLHIDFQIKILTKYSLPSLSYQEKIFCCCFCWAYVVRCVCARERGWVWFDVYVWGYARCVYYTGASLKCLCRQWLLVSADYLWWCQSTLKRERERECVCVCARARACVCERERETDGRTDRQTDRDACPKWDVSADRRTSTGAQYWHQTTLGRCLSEVSCVCVEHLW